MLSKSSRPKFKLSLQIHELSSIPLVTGQVFVKWHILHSSRGECRGKTDRVPIIDHKAFWSNYRLECTFKVSIGRNGMLSERMLIMEVWVELNAGRDRLRIGNVAVNLSEYASVASETRRYLLQESKMNSTVKVTISVVHTEGSKDYSTPPLKKAQMFHGITNLLAENKDLPQISRGIEQHNSKHILHSPTQEMYRRTFSAQWRCQAGELTPGDVVEDIFKGGSGWRDRTPSPPRILERHTHRKTESLETIRADRRESRPHQNRRSSGRFQRTNISLHRPITPISQDDPSDYDEEENEQWNSRLDRSSRSNHGRTDSILSVTPHRQHSHQRDHENRITSQVWEREELEIGKRSWAVPTLETMEDKIEKRRLAREARTPLSSAPGSSGQTSTTTNSTTADKSTRSASLSESMKSLGLGDQRNGEVVREYMNGNGQLSADDSDFSSIY
jgi:hypothetical protein